MANIAEIKTLTSADGSTAIYPRTTIEAVYGLENFDEKLEEKIPKVLSETVNIATSAWTSKTATVSCSIATAINNLIIAPSPSSYAAWGNSKIRATAQAAGEITFTCDTVPIAAVSVNIVALG